MAKTRFKIIDVPLGHGKQTEYHYFDSLQEAMMANVPDSSIYEVDENDKTLVSLLHYLPEDSWKINVE